MIDVTNVDIIKFIQKAYELSRPQGLGALHFHPGGLSEEEAKSLIEKNGEVCLDYVQGRACKMFVMKQDNKLVIGDSWYDHTDAQLSELLEYVGIKDTDNTNETQHGVSCNCDDCRKKHGKAPYDPMEIFNKPDDPSFDIHIDAYANPHKRVGYPGVSRNNEVSPPNDGNK